MELWINFKGAYYTLLISNVEAEEFQIMYGMRDVTDDFSEDEKSYIFSNREDLAVK